MSLCLFCRVQRDRVKSHYSGDAAVASMTIVNASTPFLNLLQLSRQAKVDSGPLHTILGVAFLSTFFLTRICLLLWLTYKYHVVRSGALRARENASPVRSVSSGQRVAASTGAATDDARSTGCTPTSPSASPCSVTGTALLASSSVDRDLPPMTAWYYLGLSVFMALNVSWFRTAMKKVAARAA